MEISLLYFNRLQLSEIYPLLAREKKSERDKNIVYPSYFIFGSYRPTERLKQASMVESWNGRGKGEGGWLLSEGGPDSCGKPEKHKLGVTLTFLIPLTYQSRKKKTAKRIIAVKDTTHTVTKRKPEKIQAYRDSSPDQRYNQLS